MIGRNPTDELPDSMPLNEQGRGARQRLGQADAGSLQKGMVGRGYDRKGLPCDGNRPDAGVDDWIVHKTDIGIAEFTPNRRAS